MATVTRWSLAAAADVARLRSAVLALGRSGGLAPEERSALAVAASDVALRVCGDDGYAALAVEEGLLRIAVGGPLETLRRSVAHCAELVPHLRLAEDSRGEPRVEMEMALPRSRDPAVGVVLEGLERNGGAAGAEPLTDGNREVRELLARLERWKGDLERLDGELEETNRGVVALYAELDERDQRKNDFLATLAHELRNPLGVVRTALHALRDDQGEKGSRPLELADRQLGHLARLVDDLLDVSRIDQGKINLRLKRVDLAEVVGRALDSSRSLMAGRGHRLDVELGEEPMPLNADPVRIEQVVDNLLSNAAKYTPDGGHVEVRTMRRGDTAVVEVEDDGIGISRPMLGRIFQRFAQADTTLERASGGLGLGLALVERLVHLHGGTVSAESEGEGSGSRFTVTLPIAGARPGAEAWASDDEDGDATIAWARDGREATSPAPPEEASGQPSGQAGDEPAAEEPSGPRRILLVEDNDDAREMLALLLESRGFEVDTARDGGEGVERGQAGGFDAAVVDIGLPGLDGYEVARRLRAAELSAGMLLVALSGYGRPEDRDRSSEAGFDHHLVKPVEPDKLCRLLKAGRGG